MLKSFAISLLLLILPISAQALNFQMVNAPLSDFAEWISGQTRSNIILGSGVEGNISFYTQAIDPKDLKSFFVLVMDAYDYDCIQEKNSISVVQRRDKEEGRGEEEEPDLHAQLFTLKNIHSTDIEEKIRFLVESLSDSRSKVIVNAINNNNLLVLLEKEDTEVIASVIRELDQASTSLLVEAIIFEYQKSDVENIGFSASLGEYEDGLFSAFNRSDLVDLASLPGGLVASFIKANTFAGLVQAIETNDTAKLLSTPKILVVDGGTGHINVGQNVPFVTGSTTVTSDGTTSPYQTIERKDIGTTLDIKPKVISRQLIELNVFQESSSVTTETYASDIVTNTRSISTLIQIKPGQIIQLGGLVSSNASNSDSKVPFFGSVPILGRLFHSKSSDDRQVELMIFLRVTLV